jgi:UTP:GlnB (protein PII) uridylyltransferase
VKPDVARPCLFAVPLPTGNTLETDEPYRRSVAGLNEVRSLLAMTPVVPALADELLTRAPELWLAGESPDVIAGDILMCHPALGVGEVRIQVAQLPVNGVMRVSLLARDRPGLLAATTAALAAESLSVIQAAAMTWPDRGWAVQRVLVADPGRVTAGAADRDLLRARLRAAVIRPVVPALAFAPAGPAEVSVADAAGGHRLVHVAAPDRQGLLAAISTWLDREGCNILVARAEPFGELVVDRFLVDGDPDADRLAAYLSGRRVKPVTKPVTSPVA